MARYLIRIGDKLQVKPHDGGEWSTILTVQNTRQVAICQRTLDNRSHKSRIVDANGRVVVPEVKL